MKFSDILYILRNAVCAPAPPPSPAIKPIALADLEAELLTTARLALQGEVSTNNQVPAFGGPPLASKKRSFEEVFGEDSDEESEDD